MQGKSCKDQIIYVVQGNENGILHAVSNPRFLSFLDLAEFTMSFGKKNPFWSCRIMMSYLHLLASYDSSCPIVELMYMSLMSSVLVFPFTMVFLKALFWLFYFLLLHQQTLNLALWQWSNSSFCCSSVQNQYYLSLKKEMEA